MFIAEKQGVAVASAILYIDESIAGIHDVEVVDAFRGQGIGTALLQAACEFARDESAQLAVLAASEQGAKFYPRFGFRITGRYPTYYYSIKKQKQDAIRQGISW